MKNLGPGTYENIVDQKAVESVLSEVYGSIGRDLAGEEEKFFTSLIWILYKAGHLKYCNLIDFGFPYIELTSSVHEVELANREI